MRELCEPLGTMAIRGEHFFPLDWAAAVFSRLLKICRPMCRIDQHTHRQIVHCREGVSPFYRGDLIDARAPPEHRGERTLPVERIARRLGVVADIMSDHDGAAKGEGQKPSVRASAAGAL